MNLAVEPPLVDVPAITAVSPDTRLAIVPSAGPPSVITVGRMAT